MTCLPIMLFHKVRTSCVLFRAQIAMALWTEFVCLCRMTLIGKPCRKRKLQYDDGRHTYIKFLVHGLVMKSLHPKPCTYTVTKNAISKSVASEMRHFPFLALRVGGINKQVDKLTG